MALLSPQPPIDLRPAPTRTVRQLLPDQRFRSDAASMVRDWLLHDGSLTERIQRRHGPVQVTLDREGIGMPSALEAQLLDAGRSGGWWIREITMSADGAPRLRARTLVPPDAAQLRTRLMGLGRTPLGRLLFRADRLRPEVVRGGRGFAHSADRGDWLRLTRYLVHGESMLVIECPLSALLTPAADRGPLARQSRRTGADARRPVSG